MADTVIAAYDWVDAYVPNLILQWEACAQG
jgi:hypothetical protein